MTNPYAPPSGPPPAPGGSPGPGGPLSPVQPPAADAVRAARVAAASALAGLVAAVPVAPLGLALGVLALVVARRVRRACRAVGAQLPGAATVASVVGAGAVLLSGLVLAGMAVLWPQLRAYQECSLGANTVQSAQRCQDEFRQAVGDRFGLDLTPR